jgi:hypothetical protein
MYYFDKHRIGFLHLPKTGGSAFSRFLLEALGARGDTGREVTRVRWHEPLRDKIQVLGADVAAGSTFIATVRNPYAVAVSLYFWMQKKVREKHADIDEYPDSERVAAMDFDQYMQWHAEHGVSYERYFLEGGEVPANLRLLRLEHIEADADAVLNGELGLGLDIAVPVWRASEHGPVMSYLQPRHLAALNQQFAWPFANLYADARVDAPAPIGRD